MSQDVDSFYAARPAWAKGCVSLHDARFLDRRVRAAAVDRVVEIGTAAGVSTAVLANALAGGRVYSYDISPRFYGDTARAAGDAAREMLGAEALGRVTFRTANAMVAAREHDD